MVVMEEAHDKGKDEGKIRWVLREAMGLGDRELWIEAAGHSGRETAEDGAGRSQLGKGVVGR